jgi:hypothetical protein
LAEFSQRKIREEKRCCKRDVSVVKRMCVLPKEDNRTTAATKCKSSNKDLLFKAFVVNSYLIV